MKAPTLAMKVVAMTVLATAILPLVHAVDVQLINTDPAPIEAGEYADVTIRFTKDAEDAENFATTFAIEETDFIIPVSERTFSLNRFRSGDVITHTFRLYFDERLPEGYVDIPAIIIADDLVQNADLRVFVEEADTNPELYVGSVETTPNELLPDTDDNDLHVTIQNLGDKDAELVRVELVPRSPHVKPSYAYSMLDSVATIAAGDEETLEYTIDLDVEARGELPMELLLRYRAQRSVGDAYDVFEERLPFTLPVADAPLLTVVNVTYLDSFQAGSTENRVRVAIRNDGSEEAEEVRVRAIPDISYPFIFELTTEYVASEIPSGETANVEFRVEVLRDAAEREYPVTLRLESLVGETRYARDDTMDLIATPGREIDPQRVGIGIIVVALIASAWLGFVIWKRRRRRKR